jgi:opacity protein-like surface antigen
MKNKSLLLALLALASVRVMAASALELGQGSPYYGWYDAGVAYIQDAELTSFFDEAVAGAKVAFDPGFRVGLGVGYRFTKVLSGELEAGFQYNTLKSIEGAARSEARMYQVPLMANLVLQLFNKTRLVPFLSAGVGSFFAYLDADDVWIGGTRISDSSDCFTFAYQGTAGLRYDFSGALGLGLSYRYSVADAPAWKYSDPEGVMKLDAMHNHAGCIHFGFRF